MCVLKHSTDLLESSITENMPMDYQMYLYACSPPAITVPGFDIQAQTLMRLNETIAQDSMGGREKNGVSIVSPVKAKPSLLKNCNGFNKSVKLETPQMIESLKALSLRASQRTSLQTTSLKATSLKATSLQTTSLTRRKRVSFADEYGLELLMVREFTESSNSPPMIRRGLLSAITTGASASVTERPPLVLQFPQPASDYYQFRERLERLSVSLENVILKDYNIMGTVKVKNIAFEKKVKVRFTYDSWESFTDVHANYVSKFTFITRLLKSGNFCE